MRQLPLLLGLTLIAAASTTALAASQQTLCTYDEPLKMATVTVPDAGEATTFIVLTVQSGAIMSQRIDILADAHFGPKEPCGAATTSNTDLIRAQGGGASGFLLVVDETTGSFTPGATAEATGTSEIEFEFHPRGAVLFGGALDPRTVRLGTGGANVNGDDDVDVTFFSSPAAFSYSGGPGADHIAATGGFGTGDVATIDFAAGGGGGNDILVAGTGHSFLHGNEGDDLVIGGPETDSLTGGSGGDRLSGGAESDELDGGAHNDVLRGGPGKDTLRGREGHDRCIGGPGRDELRDCENEPASTRRG